MPVEVRGYKSLVGRNNLEKEQLCQRQVVRTEEELYKIRHEFAKSGLFLTYFLAFNDTNISSTYFTELVLTEAEQLLHSEEISQET